MTDHEIDEIRHNCAEASKAIDRALNKLRRLARRDLKAAALDLAAGRDHAREARAAADAAHARRCGHGHRSNGGPTPRFLFDTTAAGGLPPAASFAGNGEGGQP